MDRPEGERFGILSFVYQLMPQIEFEGLLANPVAPVVSPRASALESKSSPTRRIAVVKVGSPRSVGSGTELPSLSPQRPSIHERYIRRNGLWMGHHSSTHTESELSRTAIK
jgi:hypothetical protein